MLTPEEEEAERKAIARITSQLQGARPFWSRDDVELHRTLRGAYTLRNVGSEAGSTHAAYIGISPKGEVTNMAGPPVTATDVADAIAAMEDASLFDVKTKILRWDRKRKR
jgi:hypothetical protein